MDETSSTQVKASVDEQGNLKWLKIVVNGIVLYLSNKRGGAREERRKRERAGISSFFFYDIVIYGQFLDKAVLDGHVRTIRFTLNTTDNTITTIVPHFWSYAGTSSFLHLFSTPPSLSPSIFINLFAQTLTQTTLFYWIPNPSLLVPPQAKGK